MFLREGEDVAIFSINSRVKTVTIHKEQNGGKNAKEYLPKLQSSSPITNGNQIWIIESDPTLTKSDIDNIMNNRYWVILICSDCFK